MQDPREAGELILKMSATEFSRLSEFIYSNYGIKMPVEKKIMLQSRLQKRLRALNIPSFTEYVDYVFSKNGHEEIVLMMDQVSTNKTDFFREPHHFDFLVDTILPELTSRSSVKRNLKVWSAGCSSGEEAYTLAMVMENYIEQNKSFDYHIHCTDISTKVLQIAVDAVYKEDRVAVVPLELKKKYLLRSKDPLKKTVRITPELRAKTTFARLNLMDSYYDAPDSFDMVFCRNVLIYFDKKTQEKVINKLAAKLRRGGYFFLGHSESIMAMNVPLKQVKPTIFVKV
ncbi:protein-glutamate O-methyltransferase [uncultured Acetobacteroides sp.]|uniref:CheR family methyltransferase n=1 Tax=uncultured Acetobacteroides sp. TaxID=1760811 RepID=UPI0029F4D5BE|nr:protein-glutamate O-methyltransferase [uncultured Acetobacteroides sp.]